MGFAAMLADLHILIFCNAISYSPGRLSLFIFCTYLHQQFFNGANVRADEYKFQHSSKPYRYRQAFFSSHFLTDNIWQA